MLAHYGVDVLDPRTSLRRIWQLVRRLPPGVWPDHESPLSWSFEAYLLADVVDALAGLTYVTIRANGGKPRQPKPIRRPRAKPVRPQGGRTGWSQLRDLFEMPGVYVEGAGGG